MTWAKTPIKYKDEIIEKTNEDGEVEYVTVKRAIQFTENDFTSRIPSKKYYNYKIVETLALAAANTNSMLKTYIVCPGFIYGCGEDFFYEYFRMAWNQTPDKLPVIGDGSNIIPTIHIQDVANLIKRIIEKKPINRYIFAVDRTYNRTLKDLMIAISKCVGNGEVEHVDFSRVEEIPNFNEMIVNLDIKPSDVFDDKKEEIEDKEDFERRRFKWNCEVILFYLVWNRE
jgi:nucleoside-diphosphate-sugar epimerase